MLTNKLAVYFKKMKIKQKRHEFQRGNLIIIIINSKSILHQSNKFLNTTKASKQHYQHGLFQVF